MNAYLLFMFFPYALSEHPLPKLVKPAHIEVLTIKDCRDRHIVPPEGLSCKVDLVGDGPTKSLDASLTVPFDIDDTLMYHCTFQKWIKDAWKPIPFNFSGSICKHGPRFLPGIWEKMAKAVNVSPQCPIKAGTYVLKGFTAEPTDVQLPSVFVGKYLVSATVLKADVPLLCKESEVNIVSG